MPEYEIRILNSNRSPTALVETGEASDADAIRSAKRLANGRAVEVWRDIDCIFRATACVNAVTPSD